MGLENREYMRQESAYGYGTRGGGAMQNIVVTLIVVNVVVFLGQTLVKGPISLSEFPEYYDTRGFSQEEIEQGYNELRQKGQLPETSLLNSWMMLDSSKVLQGQIWRLTTYDFLHSTDSIFHILFNMWLLYISGIPVAMKYGQREFLWFYLIAGVFSGLFYILWGALNQEYVAAVGASGAVSAVLVLYAMNWPRQTWLLYGIIPVPVFLLVLISGGLDLFPMLRQLAGSPRQDNIAHAAHIGGMLFGFLYYQWQGQFTRVLPDWFSFRHWLRPVRRPKIRIHRPDSSEVEMPVPEQRKPIPADVSQRVDELLEKISRSGEASLTAEEREFLHQSSRKYR